MIRKSIVLVSFPFDDFSATKVRPALCLTNRIGKMEHVVVAFISSKIPVELFESDLIIRLNSIEWEGTGLKSDSVVRLHKLTTLPTKVFRSKLGDINENLEKKVAKKLKKMFCLEIV